MKRAIKSYIAFTTAGYRMVCLVALPLALLAFSGFILAATEEPNGIYPENMLFAYVILYEILIDYWLFGSICSRDYNGMEYVKTSREGVAVLQKGIVGDLLRRLVYMLGFGVFCSAFTGNLQGIVTAMLAYIAAVACLNLTRHFATWQTLLLAAMGAVVLFALLAIVCWLPSTFRPEASAVFWAELAGCSILVLAASAVTVWHMTYCVKGSYYEK